MKDFTMSNPTRRSVIAGLTASVAAFVALPARALTSQQAEALINRAVGDINSVINSGKSQSAMYGDFETIFRRYADVSTIARSALGPPARSASNGQINAFTDAFVGYLSRKYGKRFREFIGGEITVTGAKTVKNFQEVSALATLRGQAPFVVSFMVSDRSGKDLFFDLLIEGISLLKSERAEVGAMLDKRRGDIDALISDLKTAG
jgi:phospholipid transport system substrate-binding protein